MAWTQRPLTVADVDAVRFGRPPWGKRGYNEEQVDALVELIKDRLESRNGLSAADVEHAAFSKPAAFRRGYNEDQVDEFLDRAVATIQELDRRRRSAE